MIFDSEIELKNIEIQPEWCGVMDRVKILNEDKNRLIQRFDRDPKEWVQKQIEKHDEEIKFFENILLFWSRNYKNMQHLSDKVNLQVKIVNEGEKLAGLIDDLRTAFKYQEEENLIIIQTFIKLCEQKELDSKKIETVLFKLRNETKEYVNWINSKINQIVNE